MGILNPPTTSIHLEIIAVHLVRFEAVIYKCYHNSNGHVGNDDDRMDAMVFPMTTVIQPSSSITRHIYLM